MKQLNVDFATAMHMVRNGGFVACESWEGEYVVGTNDVTGSVYYYDIVNGKLELDEPFVPDVYLIGADDWYLVDMDIFKDTRTKEDVQFDELVLELRELVDDMLETKNISNARSQLATILSEVLEEYDDIMAEGYDSHDKECANDCSNEQLEEGIKELISGLLEAIEESIRVR